MIGSLRAVVLDAPDVRRLADFSSTLGGWSAPDGDDELTVVETGDSWRLAVQHSPDHRPPRWPDPAHPQQLHLDVTVTDVEAAVLALGATSLGVTDVNRRVYADPAGKPFCLCWELDDRDG